jgi:hypothetical protein
MEKQAGTWRGLMSTIKDTLSLAAAQGLRPFFDLAKEGLAGLTDFLSGETFTGWVERVAELLDGAGMSIGLFFDRMGSGMPLVENLGALVTNLGIVFGMSAEDARELGAGVEEVLGFIQGAAADIWALIEPVVQAAAGFVSWKDVALALAVAIGAFVIPIIASIISAIAPLLLVGAALVAGIALVRNAWENNWGGIRDKVQAVIAVIVPLVQNAIASIKEWWAANGEAILAKAAAVWEAIKAAISAALELVWGIVQGVLSRIRAFWEEHGDAIKTIVGAFMGVIRGIIESVTGFIQGIWEAHGEAILAGAEAAWEGIKNTIDRLINQAGEIIEAVADAIQGNWEGFHEHINNATEGAWNAVRDFIDEAINTVKGIVETVSEAISGAWDTAMGAIQSATQPAIDLINGIKDAAQGFWNWLKGKVFDFQISLPSLPDWATPGSPLPIHTAWKAFERDLNSMTIRPRLELESGLVLAAAGGFADSGSRTAVHIGQLILPDVRDAQGLLEELNALTIGGIG